MEQSKSDSHIQYNPVQPENTDPMPSAQSFQNAIPRHSSVKPVLNYSIRTGEEFSLEFMRDRANPKVPFVQYAAVDPSHTPGYLELKGILGISHTGSESGSDISMINMVERNHLENNSSLASSNASDSSPKIKILCSFGGKILPRPSDGKLRYVGGSTRIIRIRKDIYWQELRQKLIEVYIETYAVKYQLPGEDLDALVSVSSDEDLLNMMEECNMLGIGEGSQKLRLFLFSVGDLDDTNFSHANSGGDHEFQFVVAVNGMDVGSRRESGMNGLMSSSTNNLSELDGQNGDYIRSNTSPLTSVPVSSPAMPPNFSNVYENRNQMHHGEANLNFSPVETSVPLNTEGLMQTRQPQLEEKPKGESVVKQEIKQAKIRSPRDDVAEGKLPPKPKMNEERPVNVPNMPKVARSNDNDTCTSNSALGPDNLRSDLIDLSYLEPPVVPPSRVYHSERIPRGPAEMNRLTKSDDSLGSQLLATHLQSDADTQGFISESEASHEPIEDRMAVNNNQVSDPVNVADATTANDKKIKFDKPADAGSQPGHQGYPAPNTHAPSGVVASGGGDILIDINDRFPRDFLSDVFARAISEESHGISVLPQDGVGMSMNIENHDPKHWSYFQKLANGEREEFRQKDVSLIDQDHLAFLSGLPKVEEELSSVYNVSGTQVGLRNAFVEDGEREIAGSASTSMQPHYNPSEMKSSEGMQFDDLADNMRMPDSEYTAETRNDALSSIDPSLADLDISSLQIIRNEDLEELRELGSGTFGTVYHGKWRGTDVAIKRIKKSCFAGRSSEQERLTVEFWREAVILSKLHHPNVMAFYGVVQDGPDGTLATVTEFMVDGSLRHVLLRKDRHLDHRKRLIIAMDAAFGMEYLHSKNIVHFDLKCDNLLVNMKDSSRPICKVGDFGLSKIKRNTLVSGGVRGTLPWMAPELLNGGSNKVSEKVDVFSFGIVLWEILTREEPYANMHYGAIIGGIVNNTLRPSVPSDCDPDWRRLMEQCWSPDPAVRPSFTEITNQLRIMSAACQSKAHAHKAS
uniref:uncharacterized protein LOC122591025 n=1 Tax=Erigeron canadensis TaxID=72917 RepID=UPI001CB940A3|nr:uncharacterized protein LOC122591025 [Erigeron canadensis]